MILITGATGTVGSEVARRLPPGVRHRVLVREPTRVAGAAEVTVGDYRDARSLREALTGVHAAFLVTLPFGNDDERFLEAAGAAGVRHVVKLSAAAVCDEGAQDAITRWQRRNEALLRASGMAWTILRPRAFMSNTRSWASSIRAERVVRALYGTSANSCVDPRDVAEVAVRVLLDGGHEGMSHLLTGPGAITAVQQTADIARLTGLPLAFEELAPEEAHRAFQARYSPEIAEALLRSAMRQRDGAKERIAGTVLELTGRPAREFADWVRGHLSEFSG